MASAAQNKRNRGRVFRTVFILLMLAFCLHDLEADPPALVTKGFFSRMVGEWVGTFEQSTDNIKAPIKYFHATARQTGPDSFETVFKYYKVNPRTKKRIAAGETRMETRIEDDGTAKNTIFGRGDVLVSEKERQELHRLYETMTLAAPNVLEGSGSGVVSVVSVQGPGRDGNVSQYASTWSMENDVLRISQQFKVKFRILFLRRTYDVYMGHTIRRGNDLDALIQDFDKTSGARPAQ